MRVGPIDNIYLGKIIYPKIKAEVHSNKGYFIIMFTYQWSRRKICSTRLSYSSESEPGTLIWGQLFQLHRWACRWILGRFSNWCWIKNALNQSGDGRVIVSQSQEIQGLKLWLVKNRADGRLKFLTPQYPGFFTLNLFMSY